MSTTSYNARIRSCGAARPCGHCSGPFHRTLHVLSKGLGIESSWIAVPPTASHRRIPPNSLQLSSAMMNHSRSCTASFPRDQHIRAPSYCDDIQYHSQHALGVRHFQRRQPCHSWFKRHLELATFEGGGVRASACILFFQGGTPPPPTTHHQVEHLASELAIRRCANEDGRQKWQAEHPSFCFFHRVLQKEPKKASRRY